MALYIEKNSKVDAIRLNVDAGICNPQDPDTFIQKCFVGDWIVSYNDGRQELVPNYIFAEQYENIYIGKKIKTHIRKKSIVWAIKLTRDTVINKNGIEHCGHAGDWLVSNEDGNVSFWFTDQFHDKYEPFEGEDDE